MSYLEETFTQIRRIANELVDAESMPCYDKHEIEAVKKARENALECMRLIGTRKLEKIGKEHDWGT